MRPTRRDVLKAGAGAVAFTSLAGCVGSSEDADGYTAFFALQQFAEAVAGDEMEFENPVGTGQMGHGWSPPSNFTADVAATEVFIYLDTQEFAWAQDIAETLEADYDDVAVVDALDGLEPHLIPFDYEGSDGIPEPDHGHEYPEENLRLDDFDIWDLRTNGQLGYWHVEHWHGGVPDVLLDASVPVGITIEDVNDRIVPLGKDETYWVDARIADGEDEGVVDIESHGDHVEFHGRELGDTAVVFEVYREGERIYDTAEEPSPVSVVEELETDGTEFYDPHTWVDPVLVQLMVETIADELADLDPDNADSYQRNADEYIERLEDVDRQLRETVSEAELDVAVFAGHDSYQYIERRYDFRLETPVGISPDSEPTFDDIAGLIDVIEEHGIDTVLYDPFEAIQAGEDVPQEVEMIMENSDVENAEPLTPVEGTTEEWEENGWGWVEQMENVNIPSLNRALNPE